MENHIHMAIQAGEIPLSRIIQNISFRYTKTPPSSTDIRAAIAQVCKLYKLKRGDLTATGKGQSASEARAVAAWIVRELPDLYLVDLDRENTYQI
jgi:chromosomal replication initiation ATPase DnaA